MKAAEILCRKRLKRLGPSETVTSNTSTSTYLKAVLGKASLKLLRFEQEHDPIVITGIGLITSIGHDRETTWQALRQGTSGVRSLAGIPYIPDDLLIGAPVPSVEGQASQLKVIALAQAAAAEAIQDSALDLANEDRTRIGCAISGHMGDTYWVAEQGGLVPPRPEGEVPWWSQWLPNTACSHVANQHDLCGPRLCHSTACASGLIDILSAVRSIRDGQCDVAVAGSAEGIHPLFAAGFRQLRVLAAADDPQQASRPFDKERTGFVMGEGAAMFVIERLSHAQARGAMIYAEIAGGKMQAEAHHVTSLDEECDSLSYLISATLRRADLRPEDVGYVNAHATGTKQNDVVETKAIHRAFGSAAEGLCVGANKSSIGHLVNAAGSVELALTVLTLRDGFAPPTLNLVHPDPECNLNYVPLVGQTHRVDNALKISCAFGGHLVGMAVRRWNDAASGFGYPDTLPAKVA